MQYSIEPGFEYEFDEDGNPIRRIPLQGSSPMSNRPQTPAEWELQRIAEETPLITNLEQHRGKPNVLFMDEGSGDLIRSDQQGNETIEERYFPKAKPKQEKKAPGEDVLEDWNSFWQEAKPEAEKVAMAAWDRVDSGLVGKVSPLERRRKAQEAYDKTMREAEKEYKDLFGKQWSLVTEGKKNEREKGEEEGRYKRRRKDYNEDIDRRETRADEKTSKKEAESERKASVAQVNDFYNRTHGTLSEILRKYQKDTSDPMADLTDEERAVKSPERILKALKDLDVKRANDVTRVRRGEKPVDMENMGEWLQYLSSPEDVPGKFPGGKYVPKSQRGAESLSTPKPGTTKTPPQGARQAPDGNYYIPDPARPGKYLRWKG